MTKPIATYADVLAAPDGNVAELIKGELYLSPRPATLHALAATRLAGALINPGDPDPWIILAEPEIHFGRGPDIVVPDLAGWHAERFPVEAEDAKFITTSPDWVCEVLSPSTARIDRGKKSIIYAMGDVGHWWIVDPLAKVLEIFRLLPGATSSGRWLLVDVYSDDESVCAEPFMDRTVNLRTLWTWR